MRVSIIASPFIAIPPRRYGGTELFISELASGLKEQGVEVVVYACGESTIDAEVRSLYPKEEWPITGEIYADLKDLNHTGWALRDCWETADIVHLNNSPGLAFSRFAADEDDASLAAGNGAARLRHPTSGKPHLSKREVNFTGPKFVYTIHHPHADRLSQFYSFYPNIHYVTISRFQQAQETMPNLRTIHHGIALEKYQLQSRKQHYLSFIGRIAPVKGTHIAIEVAKRAGIPLKIAGQVQPVFRDYFESKVKPHLDGRNVEYVGEADLEAKNELLGNSMAMVFPIQWNEPFGLVMIEAMATGTPVLAFPGGAVEEIVADGVSGFICHSPDEMIERLRNVGSLAPAALRSYVRQNFSVEKMARDYLALYREVLGLPQTVEHAAALSLNELDDTEEPPGRAVA